MAETEQIHFVADISLIHTLGKGRYPGSWNGYGNHGSPDLYLDIARLLEHGMFDGAFFADVAGTPLFDSKTDDTVEWSVAWPRHDPLPMAIAMAGITRHLGFITTMSMTYHPPFNAGGLNGGFMVDPRRGVPGGFARSVHEVVPVLQRRTSQERDRHHDN